MWIWPLLLAISAQTVGATPAPVPAVTVPQPVSCAAAEFRQFDFWIGEWEVTSAGKPAGRSRIESILDDCAILENWRGATGGEGKSLNTWNSAEAHWEQYWVSAGAPLHLSGGLIDGRMVLIGRHAPDPKTGKIRAERITWTRNDDGSVRQLWESSGDDGKTWAVSFDGLYRKVAIASPSHT